MPFGDSRPGEPARHWAMAQPGGLLWFSAAHLFALAYFYWPVLTGQADFFHRDIPLYFEPLARYLGEALRSGRFPLWNDGLYTGMPQVAVGHPNIFYPFTWLLALLPFSQGLGLYLLAHQFLIGAASFSLVRRFGWGTAAAWVAGFAAAWNGYILGLQSNFQLISAAAWIPVLFAALAAVEDGAGRLRRLPAFLSAVSAFLLIATGAPELIGPGLALACFWTVFLAFRSGDSLSPSSRAWLSPLLLRFAALGLGVALAAPLVLPAVEWLRLSIRSEGIAVRNVLAWSTEWYQWLAVLVSHPFGFDEIQSIPRYLDSPFLGAGILSLAFWGLHGLSWRRRATVLAAFGVLVVVAAGQTTPAGEWLVKHVPGFTSIRYPVKLSILPLFCLILAAARGIGRIGNHAPAGLVLRGWIVLASTFSAAAIWVNGDLSRTWYWTTVAPGPLGIRDVFLQKANHNLAVNLFGAALAVLLLAALAWLYSRERISRPVFSGAAVAFCVLPMLASALRYERNWVASPVFVSEPAWRAISASVSPGGQPRTWRLFPLSFRETISSVSLEWLRANSSRVPPLSEVEFLWLSHARSERALLMENTVLDSPFLSSWGYEATYLRTYNSLRRNGVFHSSAAPESFEPVAKTRSDRPLARFCSLTASRYLLLKPESRARKPQTFASGELFRAVTDLPAFNRISIQPPRLYEVPSARPRAYITRSVESVGGQKDLLDRLAATGETAFDRIPGHSYVFDRDRQLVGQFAAGGDAGSGPDQLSILEDRGERIRLRARLQKPGLIVLADQFYPGWEATIDGKPAPILQTNLVNRGVLAGAGEHIVEMRYRPGSLRTGFAIAAVALLLWLPVAWRLGRTPKPRPAVAVQAEDKNTVTVDSAPEDSPANLVTG